MSVVGCLPPAQFNCSGMGWEKRRRRSQINKLKKKKEVDLAEVEFFKEEHNEARKGKGS